MPATTRPHSPATRHLAFELGNTEWKLAMTTSIEQGPVVRPARARRFRIAAAADHRAAAGRALRRADHRNAHGPGPIQSVSIATAAVRPGTGTGVGIDDDHLRARFPSAPGTT